MKKLILFYCYFSAVGALAADSPYTIGTSQWKYDAGASIFIPGYSVHVIRSGVPVGKFQSLDNSAPGLESQSAQALNDFFDSARGSLEFMNKSLDQQRSNNIEQVKNAPAPQAPTPANPESANATVLDWPAFQECAKLALPRLKIVIHLLEREKEAEGAAREAAQAALGLALGGLDKFRASGGVVCGKVLGEVANVSNVDEILSVKLLSVLQRRFANPTERDLLLAAFVAAFHPSAEENSRGIWQAHWDRLSLHAAFQDTPLPSIDTLITEFSAYKEGTHSVGGSSTSGVRFVGVAPVMTELTTNGLKTAKELLKL